MQDKAIDHVHDGLTSRGWCIVDHQIAFQIDPLRWATALNAGQDFSQDRVALNRIAERRGAKLLQVSIQGYERRVPLLAMSEDDLARRIEWIIGKRVSGICPLEELPKPLAAPLRTAAGEEIPEHQCNLRHEMLRQAGYTRDPKHGNPL